jgi:hypothetical protein
LHKKLGSDTRDGGLLLNKPPLLVVACNLCAKPVRGISFCEQCARDQEAYFGIGELTEAPEGLRDEPLVELLNRMRRTTRRRGVHVDEPDAA